MIDGLSPYPEYRPSGVEWLGDVPVDWNIARMKTVFRERCEKGFPEEPLLAATQTKGVVRKDQYENRTVVAQNDLHLLKLVRVGDFVISLRSFQGGIEYAREQGIISPAYTILFPINLQNHGYFSWLFKSKPFVDNLSLFVTGIREGQNIDYEKLSRAPLPLPPLPDQKAIVRFLDHADARIRRAVGARRRLIALFNEEKQAVIHRAVTRGLDPGVPLKPSGVKWLGEVPAHWQVGRLSQFFTLQRGFDITKDQQQEGFIPVVSSGGISSYHNCATAKGPGIMVGRKGTAGSVHFVASDYWAHDTTLWVNDFKGNHPRFIYYILLILDLKRFDTGSANPTINRNLIHPERVAFPEYTEQIAIATYIDSAISLIEHIITATKREIDLLLEFRTRLIADVITGKLDVRGVAAGLPETTPGQATLDAFDAPAGDGEDAWPEPGAALEDGDGIGA